MKKHLFISTMIGIFLFGLLFPVFHLGAEEAEKVIPPFEQFDPVAEQLMETTNIPGLSIAVVTPDGRVETRTYGYADVEKKIPVTENTLFELASCSKAFTALATFHCEGQGMINLDDHVSDYFDWFTATYKGEKTKITLRQLLYHTSGIPTTSLAKIPVGDFENPLEKTVRAISGIELFAKPGTVFQYATVNYSIIGAIIEKVSGLTYSEYMQKNVFTPMGLSSTVVEPPPDNAEKATGYKIAFFSPKPYTPPSYAANNPAGYVLSNAKDMGKWLKYQLGMLESDLDPYVLMAQQKDDSIPLNLGNVAFYGGGWNISGSGNGLIFHSGLNPNFTTYVAFNPGKKTGLAIMANSNSTGIPIIAGAMMASMKGKKVNTDVKPLEDNVDKGSSIAAFVMGGFTLLVFLFFLFVLYEIIRGKRKFEGLTLKKIGKIIGFPIMLAPFAFGIYLLPYMLREMPWDAALVWAPSSLLVAIKLMITGVSCTYLVFIVSQFFPQPNKYLKPMPLLIILSFLTGGSNAIVIFLITISLFTNMKLVYLLYFFALAMCIYITGRKIVQTKLIRISFDIVYDLRMKLIEKIFFTSYQKFEKVENGRVFATLNNDTGAIGGSANMLVGLVTSAITAIGAFLYLASIAFWATVLTAGIVAAIAGLYYIVSRKANVFFEEARDTQNVWMGLINGMLGGFKELSLHYKRRMAYREDISHACDEFRIKTSKAIIKFVHAFLVGESLLIFVLGSVGFAVPIVFPDISKFTLMSFIMVLLYLIGPVNAILNTIPNIMQLRIAWNRIKQFKEEIPANIDPAEMEKLDLDKKEINTLEAKDIYFEYRTEDEEPNFAIGPLDFNAKKGEIIFIVGGNGSGKTSLAKLLTGLYITEQGYLKIDGNEVNNYELGEFFSAVFSDFHLFDKLYDIDLSGREAEVENYLKLLHLDQKVQLKDNAFSTLNLSGGQRKRLALLQCYLEERPVYLFDEIAADQDPQFRKFFYRDLLLRMKDNGKIVIAITHDDHYFDVADKLIKMDMGKIDELAEGEVLTVTK